MHSIVNWEELKGAWGGGVFMLMEVRVLVAGSKEHRFEEPAFGAGRVRVDGNSSLSFFF